MTFWHDYTCTAVLEDVVLLSSNPLRTCNPRHHPIPAETYVHMMWLSSCIRVYVCQKFNVVNPACVIRQSLTNDQIHCCSFESLLENFRRWRERVFAVAAVPSSTVAITTAEKSHRQKITSCVTWPLYDPLPLSKYKDKLLKATAKWCRAVHIHMHDYLLQKCIMQGSGYSYAWPSH